MDYIPGKTLEDTLRDAGGRVHWRSVVDWGIALCDVLAYLHSRTPPFVFRDLKLPNVMLDARTGRPVLIDFGITRQMASSSGTAIGTWGYVPYEQILGKAEPRSDLYALGATLHALLTGRQPDVEYTRLQRTGLDVERTMRALFPPANTLVPDVPPALAQVVTRATSFDMSDRFPDADTMSAALRQVSHTAQSTLSARPTASATTSHPSTPMPNIPPTVAVAPPVPQSNQVDLTRHARAAKWAAALQPPVPQSNRVALTPPTAIPAAAPTSGQSLTLPASMNVQQTITLWAAQNKGKIISTSARPHWRMMVQQTYRIPTQLTVGRFLMWLVLGIILGFAAALLVATLLVEVSFSSNGVQAAASSGSAGVMYLLCLVVVPIVFIIWRKRGRKHKLFITTVVMPVVNQPSSLHVHVSASENSNEAQASLSSLVHALGS